jgi:hypothetical protein
MKIYLDDERQAPEDWILVKGKREFRDLIQDMSDVELATAEFSLDHYISYSRAVTGMTCLEILIDELKHRKISPSLIKMSFHSSDDDMNAKMSAAWSKCK